MIILVARFLPPSSPPPSTHVHLRFTTTPFEKGTLPLSLLQVSSAPLAVIGVADLSDTRTNHNQKIGQFQKVLEELDSANANGVVYPLTRRCFGVEQDVSAYPVGSTPREGNFPTPADATPRVHDSSVTGTPRRVEESATFEGMVEIDASDEGKIKNAQSSVPDKERVYYDRKGHEEKMVVIPKDGNVEVVLGLLMADVIASVLTEFGEIITALESGSGAQTLQASMLPTLSMQSKPRPTSLSSNDKSARLKSAPGSLLAVTNTTLPARTPSPASSSRNSFGAGSTVPGPASPSIEHSDRGNFRPQSVAEFPASYANDPALRGFGNTSTGPGRTETKATLKRSSTGFSLSGSVGRVMSGTKPSSSIDIVRTTSPVSTNSPSIVSATGRLRKVTADLWLLSGRLQEAISAYNEALSSFKGLNDHLWHASAYEGLATATLLNAWEARNPEHGNVPFLASTVSSGAHEYLTQAHALYSKSTCPPESLFPHGAESGESIIARLYASTALKHARLLLVIWAAGGYGVAALNSLVTNVLPRSYPPADYPHRARVFLKLTTMSKINRSQITRIAAQAHGPWIKMLPETLQMEVTVDLASIQRLLGLDRREVLFDREVNGLGIGSIATRRFHEERAARTLNSRRDSNASMVSKDTVDSEEPSTNQGTTWDVPTTANQGGFVATRQSDIEPGTKAIIELVHRTLDILGLDIEALQEPAGKGALAGDRYGWPELQVEFVREAVTAAETLAGEFCSIGC